MESLDRRSPDRRRRTVQRRGCERCGDRRPIDYKDVAFLRRFLEDGLRLRPARKTGCPAQCQHRIAQAIKRARFMALLPAARSHFHASQTARG